MPQGTLDVYVEGAVAIKDTALLGKGSPYCTLTVGTQVYSSPPVEEGGTHPYINTRFEFNVDSSAQHLMVAIFSKKALTDNDLLGHCTIFFKDVFYHGHVVPVTAYALSRPSGRPGGHIRLSLTFHAAQPRPPAPAPPALVGPYRQPRPPGPPGPPGPRAPPAAGAYRQPRPPGPSPPPGPYAVPRRAEEEVASESESESKSELESESGSGSDDDGPPGPYQPPGRGRAGPPLVRGGRRGGPPPGRGGGRPRPPGPVYRPPAPPPQLVDNSQLMVTMGGMLAGALLGSDGDTDSGGGDDVSVDGSFVEAAINGAFGDNGYGPPPGQRGRAPGRGRGRRPRPPGPQPVDNSQLMANMGGMLAGAAMGGLLGSDGDAGSVGGDDVSVDGSFVEAAINGAYGDNGYGPPPGQRGRAPGRGRGRRPRPPGPQPVDNSQLMANMGGMLAGAAMGGLLGSDGDAGSVRGDDVSVDGSFVEAAINGAYGDNGYGPPPGQRGRAPGRGRGRRPRPPGPQPVDNSQLMANMGGMLAGAAMGGLLGSDGDAGSVGGDDVSVDGSFVEAAINGAYGDNGYGPPPGQRGRAPGRGRGRRPRPPGPQPVDNSQLMANMGGMLAGAAMGGLLGSDGDAGSVGGDDVSVDGSFVEAAINGAFGDNGYGPPPGQRGRAPGRGRGRRPRPPGPQPVDNSQLMANMGGMLAGAAMGGLLGSDGDASSVGGDDVDGSFDYVETESYAASDYSGYEERDVYDDAAGVPSGFAPAAAVGVPGPRGRGRRGGPSGRGPVRGRGPIARGRGPPLMRGRGPRPPPGY